MKAVPWKKVSSKEVYSHPRLSLLEDVVELPDGKKTTYIRHAPAKDYSICIIAINNRQEMLFQKEYSHPPGGVMWQLPGGGGNFDEDIIEAANRELSEESGFVGKNCKVLGSYYMDNRRSDRKQYVVFCTNLTEKTAKHDDEEFIETHWIPLSDIRSHIKNGEFKSATLLAALNLYFTIVEQ